MQKYKFIDSDEMEKKIFINRNEQECINLDEQKYRNINENTNDQTLDKDFFQKESFTQWVTEAIFSTSLESTCVKLVGIIGFIWGAIGIYAFYPLGYDFGKKIGDLTNKLNEDVLAIVFGIASIIPMVALAGLATRSQFKALVASRPKHRFPSKRRYRCLYRTSIFMAYVFGGFAAVAPFYVTDSVLQDKNLSLRMSMSITAYVAGFMYKVEAEIALFNRFFNYYTMGKEPIIVEKRLFLKQRFQTAVDIITELTDTNSVQILFNKLFNRPISIQTNAVSQLLQFSNNADDIVLTNDLQQQKKYAFGEKFISILGVILGATSAYTYYTIGESAAETICDSLGLQTEKQCKFFKNVFASIVVVPWGALGIWYTQKRFEEFYQYWFGSSQKNNTPVNCVQRSITITAWIAGSTAAIPLTYLALEATRDLESAWRVILVLTAFVGPTCIRASAFGKLLNNILQWCRDCQTPQLTVYKMRERCKQAALMLVDAMDKVDDEIVKKLYDSLLTLNYKLDSDELNYFGSQSQTIDSQSKF